VLLSLALSGAPVRAANAPRALEPIPVAGRQYVRLADWAKAKGFDCRWLKPGETIQLTNPAAKILFTVDSCEAHVNGLQVWLLFPIAQRNGTVYLAQMDAQSTLRPLLAPPKNPAGEIITQICLDPGHGGKDPGLQIGSNQEKKYTLLLARELREQLTQAGFKVTLTRNSDIALDLPVRPAVARRYHADLFVSLHFNTAETARESVKGVQVFCLTPAGAPSTNARDEPGSANLAPCPGNACNDRNLLLACQVQKALLKNLGAEDCGVRHARFRVLCEAVMPAILIEGGFMSHPVEGRKILDPAYRRLMARAILDGIVAYKRMVEPAGAQGSGSRR